METQLFFSISILPSVALKRWNFPDNLDLKGKIKAIFLIRSHFLSIWNNMTINKLTRGPFKKYVTCIKVFLSFLPTLHLVNFTLSPPLCYSLKITNYGMKEKKTFSMYGCFSISRYIKSHYGHSRLFRHTCMFTQPIWKK